jgi:DNA processing protein
MDKIDADRPYYLAFNCFNKIGAAALRRLEKYFPDLASAFRADSHDLLRAGLNDKLSTEFIAWRKSFCLEQAEEDLCREGISFTTWHEDSYPRYLKEISSPPPVLYFKGRLTGDNAKRLAVVGSRRHSAYGEKIIQTLIPELAEQGIEIVSGLAIGIDSLAHRSTLDTGGKTIAFLGSGLMEDMIYPYQNRRLAKDIIQSGGALVSEFSPRTPPYKQNFPRRNRLIAGLAQATLVVEAGRRSGSLITARYALEENREVLAVPGNIFSALSIGTNWLIKSGAKTITGLDDILEIFGVDTVAATRNKDATGAPELTDRSPAEKIIYAILQEAHDRSERISADEIGRKSQLDMATINSTLSILEIEGLAENDGYGYDLK